jgi:hypothetical protein
MITPLTFTKPVALAFIKSSINVANMFLSSSTNVSCEACRSETVLLITRAQFQSTVSEISVITRAETVL